MAYSRFPDWYIFSDGVCLNFVSPYGGGSVSVPEKAIDTFLKKVLRRPEELRARLGLSEEDVFDIVWE